MPGRVLTSASLHLQLLAQMSQKNKADNKIHKHFAFWRRLLDKDTYKQAQAFSHQKYSKHSDSLNCWGRWKLIMPLELALI